MRTFVLATALLACAALATIGTGQPPAFTGAPKYRVAFTGGKPAQLNGVHVLLRAGPNEWRTAAAFKAGGHEGPFVLRWDTARAPKWHLFLSDGQGGYCDALRYASPNAKWDGQAQLPLALESDGLIAAGFPKAVLLEVAP